MSAPLSGSAVLCCAVTSLDSKVEPPQSILLVLMVLLAVLSLIQVRRVPWHLLTSGHDEDSTRVKTAHA